MLRTPLKIGSQSLAESTFNSQNTQFGLVMIVFFFTNLKKENVKNGTKLLIVRKIVLVNSTKFILTYNLQSISSYKIKKSAYESNSREKSCRRHPEYSVCQSEMA